MPMTDALHDAGRRLNVETAGRPDRDAADVRPRFFAGRNDCLDLVASLETVNLLLPH